MPEQADRSPNHIAALGLGHGGLWKADYANY